MPEKRKSSRRCLTNLLSFIELRLIDEADGEAVADVDVRGTVLQRMVVGVERCVATVEGAVVALHLAGVGGAGPGVVAGAVSRPLLKGRRTVTAIELYQVLATLKPVL